MSATVGAINSVDNVMERIQCEALVLSSVDYGEADRVVTFLTAENGKVPAIAKNARKSKRRFLGALELFTWLSIQITQSKGALYRLESANVLNGFGGLRNDMETLVYASYSAELTRELSREKEPQPILFDLLRGFLTDLAEGGKGMVELISFELKALAAAGFMPRLDCCVCCGTRGKEFRFDAQQGGVLCLPCAKGSGMTISQETTLSLTKLQKDGQSCVSELSINESRRVLSVFIQYQLGKKLRSLELLEKIPK